MISAKAVTQRRSFQFEVSGEIQSGVIYVTLTFTDEAAAVAKATKLAAKRSGDPAPRFVRTVVPIR